MDDRFSTGHPTPTIDTTNDYTGFAVTSSGGVNTYTFNRNLNTGDSQDYVILNGKTNLIYSYGGGVLYSQHAGGAYGSLSMTIDTATLDVSFGSGSLSLNLDQTLVHGLLTYIAWGWFSFFLIISGRYSKYFYTFRTYLHAALGILAFLLNVIAVAGFGSGSLVRPSANSLGDKHNSISGVVSWWAAVTTIFGILMSCSRIFFGRYSFLSYYIWYIHVVGAYLLIIYSQVIILSGLYLYDSPVTFLFYFHLGILISLLIVIEVFWQLKMTWKYTDIEQIEEKDLPDMTVKAFHKFNKDKKLALFDHYVIDLSSYLLDHPGGKYVLTECIGQEVGKYFYGAYSLDNNITTHKHSFMAGKILIKLAVAKLVQPDDIKKLIQVEKISRMRRNEDEQASNKLFKVATKEEISPNIFRVKFKNPKKRFKTSVSGTNTFGRHFLVNSSKNQVSRYYTICNCMSSETYPRYISTLNKLLGDIDDETEGEQDNKGKLKYLIF